MNNGMCLWGLQSLAHCVAKQGYFLDNFDHIWSECPFLRVLGQFQKLDQAYYQTTLFSLSKYVKCFVEVILGHFLLLIFSPPKIS